MRNTNNILYCITHYFTCIYIRTLQNRSIFEKNAILSTNYTPRDKERMRFSSYTSQTQWLATVTVNGN